MPFSSLDEFILELITRLVLAFVIASVGFWAWALARLFLDRPLLPSAPILPLGPARWGGRTVSAVIFLFLGANLATGMGYAALKGVRRSDQAANPQAAVEDSTTAGFAEAVRPNEAGPPERPAEKPRVPSFDLLLINAIASVLVLLGLPVVLRLSAGAGLSDLGFSGRSLSRQIEVGAVAALLATPVVYAVQALAVRVWESNDHDVEKMLTQSMSLGMAGFALISTVVVAPLVEECLFRGVLLGWLTRLLTPSSSAAEGGAGIAAPPLSQASVASEDEPAQLASRAVASPSKPIPVPPNLVSFPAIVVTSVLFAGMHMAQWPAPLGIFLLSIALGYVYQRTGSLLTAVVMHGVFNGCGTLLLVQALLTRSLARSAEASEVARTTFSALRATVGWACTFF